MLNSEELQDKDRITHFGVTDFRGAAEKFGIKADDRTRHMYVIGKTGMGKSTMLENMAIQDIQNGEGLCFIDPHGTTAEKLLKYVPKERLGDVVYFAPFDTKYPMGLNILEHVDEDYRHLVASGLMDTFKKVFGEDVFSGRMVYLLNNAILSLLENEGESMMGINRIYADKDYRKKIISNVKDPALLAFWNEEFAKYEDKYVREASAAIQNKIGQFIMTPLIRNIVGQKHTSFDVRKLMDERKILICNFSIGQTGSENVNLIGSLLITKIYLAAMSRANLKEEELKKAPNFYFYVDEFQNFVNDSFAQILSQARKYNLGLVIAHQYTEQLTDNVKAAVFGNVGSMLTFRVGAGDAELLEKEFAPQFTADDIVNLGARQIYLRLSIDGVGSKPFSARTMPPIETPEHDYVPAVIAISRASYAKEKASAQEEVKTWYEPVIKPMPRRADGPQSEMNEKNFAESRIENKTASYSEARSENKSKPIPKSYPQTFPAASAKKVHAPLGSMQDNEDTSIKSEQQDRKVDNRAGHTNKNENKKPAHTAKTTHNPLREALRAAMEVDVKKEKESNTNTISYIDDKKLNDLLNLEE